VWHEERTLEAGMQPAGNQCLQVSTLASHQLCLSQASLIRLFQKCSGYSSDFPAFSGTHFKMVLIPRVLIPRKIRQEASRLTPQGTASQPKAGLQNPIKRSDWFGDMKPNMLAGFSSSHSSEQNKAPSVSALTSLLSL
jgi:hypothetical protein